MILVVLNELNDKKELNILFCRNGIDIEEEIHRVTYFGNGRMPGFDKKCAPRGQCTFGARLQDEEIKILAEFVKLQADQNWPNIVIADSSFR
ncbi:hypothetical protein DVH24_022095 [Malus domestica]|uniref:Cytochrome c-553 n=1 Tax=Malus domestica TaxID=3750 RepID=A0A498IYP0_MALDO|nr:hypothetical protein DVH24_022095 [Malus domestica]